MDRLLEIFGSIADTEVTAHLLQQDFVLYGLAAIALLGLLAGAIGPFVVMRQMSFSVHGASELALIGAAAALLFGLDLGAGAIVGSASSSSWNSSSVPHPASISASTTGAAWLGRVSPGTSRRSPPTSRVVGDRRLAAVDVPGEV